jgi:hypothetical protein
MQRMARLVMFVTLSAFMVVAPVLRLPGTEARAQDFGDLAPIYDASGESIGQVSAYGIYDPFDIVEPGNDLEPGTHHVLIEAGFFNTGSAPLPYDPDGLIIVDTNGFAYTRVIINNLTADSTNYFTEAGTVDPSTDFYGDNAYVVPDGVVIDRIIYSTGENHISVYDMRTAENPAGAAVPLNDQSGLPLGQIGVNSITDPFEAYDPASPPPAGTRYVAIDVMVDNQGQQPVSVAGSDFRVIDELGRLLSPAAITLTDPALFLLSDGDVPPGGAVQGMLIYIIPEGSSIAQVTFGHGGLRDQVLADIEVTASTTDSTGGCGGFVEWALDTLGGLGNVSVFPQNLQGANPEVLDAGMLSIYYQQSASTLETLSQTVPPPAVEEVHTYLIETYLVPMTNALESLMNAVAAGDYATAQGALDDMTAIQAPFNPGGEGQAVIAGLETACPKEFQELMSMGG